MLNISKPLSASQAQKYHEKEFTAAEQNYWKRGDTIQGEWHGRLADDFGLVGAVGAEEFARLAEGQHPETGKQLVLHRAVHEYRNAEGSVVSPVEHRAGWDATFSAPKSISLTALVFWELNHENPIVDVKLFKSPSFAVSNAMMLVLGIALFGSTVLLPQFMQIFLGYTAQQSGMALSPGGIVIILMMPFVGRMVGKVDPRWMIVYGFAISGMALFTMLDLNTGVSYQHVALLRVFQAAGLAFLFIPINMLSYTGIPGNKNNDVSGLTNLARNIGGSMGTAFVVTILARRQQFHQARLSAGVDLSSLNLRTRVESLGRFLVQHSGNASSLAQGRSLAQGNLYQTLLQQSTMLAYLDVIKLLAIAMVVAIPLVFLMKRPKKGAAPVGH